MPNILMAVQPKWLAKILNGEKDVEIRKTIPECLKNGEPITVWLYCTKAEPYLRYIDGTLCQKTDSTGKWGVDEADINGKVVAKCVVETYDYIENEPSYEEDYLKHNLDKTACMTSDEYYAYATWAKDGHVYALHLTALTVFDKPMELRQFKSVAFLNRPFKLSTLKDGETISKSKWEEMARITRSPQSWMYVEVGE